MKTVPRIRHRGAEGELDDVGVVVMQPEGRGKRPVIPYDRIEYLGVIAQAEPPPDFARVVRFSHLEAVSTRLVTFISENAPAPADTVGNLTRELGMMASTPTVISMAPRSAPNGRSRRA